MGMDIVIPYWNNAVVLISLDIRWQMGISFLFCNIRSIVIGCLFWYVPIAIYILQLLTRSPSSMSLRGPNQETVTFPHRNDFE